MLGSAPWGGPLPSAVRPFSSLPLQVQPFEQPPPTPHTPDSLPLKLVVLRLGCRSEHPRGKAGAPPGASGSGGCSTGALGDSDAHLCLRTTVLGPDPFIPGNKTWKGRYLKHYKRATGKDCLTVFPEDSLKLRKVETDTLSRKIKCQHLNVNEGSVVTGLRLGAERQQDSNRVSTLMTDQCFSTEHMFSDCPGPSVFCQHLLWFGLHYSMLVHVLRFLIVFCISSQSHIQFPAHWVLHT